MNREVHVRFWERLRVRFLLPTCLSILAVGWWFLPRNKVTPVIIGKVDTGTITKKPTRPIDKITHTAPPEQTSEKKKVAGKPKEPDTAWDKDANGKVDAGFTGVNRKYWDDAKTLLKSEASYKNGKRHGVQKGIFPTGEIKFYAQYQKGKAVGLHKTYIRPNVLSVAYNYKDGKKDGECKRFYENGNLKHLSIYKRGKPIGRHVVYFAKGDIFVERTYENGGKNGLSLEYHRTGNLHKEATYFFGKKTGIESLYAKDTTLTKQIDHDGKGKSTVIYDKAKGIDKR